MKHTGLATLVAGVTGALCLAGCVTSSPQHVVAQPVAQPARPVVVAAPPPPPPAVVVRPAVQEQIVAEPNDIYISAAVDSDIVLIGGSTYIWFTGPDGHRHRHLYGRGDRRQEIFRRRENLRSMAAHRGGPPPMHVEIRDQNRRLDAIRRDQIRREQQAHAARDRAHDQAHARDLAHNRPDARPVGHPGGGDHRMASNGVPHHADTHRASTPGQVQGRPSRDASAHGAPQSAPGYGNAPVPGAPAGKS